MSHLLASTPTAILETAASGEAFANLSRKQRRNLKRRQQTLPESTWRAGLLARLANKCIQVQAEPGIRYQLDFPELCAGPHIILTERVKSLGGRAERVGIT